MRGGSVLLFACCIWVVTSAVVVGATGAVGERVPPYDDSNQCVGTMTSPADGITVVSVQGARGDAKRDARLVGIGPRGEIEWVYHREGSIWEYDVDPLPDGTLFVTGTTRVDDGDDRGESVFYELDPATGEVVWSETTEFEDTHDADVLSDDEVLVANMRATENLSGNRDRLLVYNRSTDSVTWDWQFRDHYEPNASVSGDYEHDWTHVNDVDAVNDTHYLASPRNFDMVVMVNRTSGEVAWELGAPDDDVSLNQQHNPAYYESENGTPTVLVADSENDRVVEYARRDGDWTRTWRVGNRTSMSWPRDADRLPNGNTLVADSRGHRVFEVTPAGEVVWEVSTPWLVYEVERIPYGDEPDGPTIADQDATGDVQLHGDVRPENAEQEPCAAALDNATQSFDVDASDDDGGGIVQDIFGGDGSDDGESDGGGADSGDESDGRDDVVADTVGPVPVALAALAVTIAAAVAVGYWRRAT
jgi:hypothetical protein